MSARPGVHLENQDPSNRTCGHIVNVGKQKRNKVLVPRKDWLAKLKAIKGAAEATGVDVVIIARTDSIDGALPDEEPGGVKMAIDDALEAAELGVDVIWPEFNNVELDQPREFAEGVRKYYPNQMLGFNLSPSLYFGKAKKAGTLITNQQLADLGFILQFSTLFNFRTAGMALEKGLRKFLTSGIEALADLQIEEDGQEQPPITKMHQKFAGMNRWLRAGAGAEREVSGPAEDETCHPERSEGDHADMVPFTVFRVTLRPTPSPVRPSAPPYPARRPISPPGNASTTSTPSPRSRSTCQRSSRTTTSSAPASSCRESTSPSR